MWVCVGVCVCLGFQYYATFRLLAALPSRLRQSPLLLLARSAFRPLLRLLLLLVLLLLVLPLLLVLLLLRPLLLLRLLLLLLFWRTHFLEKKRVRTTKKPAKA